MKFITIHFLLLFGSLVNGSFLERFLHLLNINGNDFSCPNNMEERKYVAFASLTGNAFRANIGNDYVDFNDQSLETLPKQTIVIKDDPIELTNIKYLKLKIADLKSFYSLHDGARFYFCEKQKPMNFVFFVTKDIEKEEIGVGCIQGQTVKCLIHSCSIGLFFNHDVRKNNPILDTIQCHNKTFVDLKVIDFSYYIVFVPDDNNKGLYFKLEKNDAFILVPCPYHNWITSAFLTQYKVKDNINNNGILIDTGTDKSNIFVPVFRLSDEPQYQRHFICGELLQIGIKNLEVGFDLYIKDYNDNDISKNNIKLNGNEITCGGKSIDKAASFGFRQKKHILNSRESKMHYFGNGFKFYHKQVILVYHKDSLTPKIDKKILFIFKEGYKVQQYSPICKGFIDDLQQTFEFTLQIDKKEVLDIKLISDNSNNDVSVVYLNNDHINKGRMDVECYTIKSGEKDERFDGYYNDAFKTKLQKIINKESNNKNKPEINELLISPESERVFGMYKCQLDCNNCDRENKVKDRDILLLPSTLYQETTYLKVFSDSKDFLTCDLKIDKYGKLKLMNINHKGQMKVDYDAVRNVPDNIFKKDNKIVKYIDDKYEIKDGSFIECSYTIFDKPYILQKKIIQYNELRNQSDDVANKILVPVIIGVGVLIFVIIGAILLVTFRVVKKRRKVKLLSMASSASGASSMSGSKFSKVSGASSLSRSKSKSRSRLTSSKTSTKKSKSNNNRSKTRSNAGSFAG